MTLRIIHFADTEETYDKPERIARLGGLIRSLSDEDTIILGAGDNVAPGALALVTEGKQAIEFFRAIEADIDTFGNHDFDYGVGTLLNVVNDSPQQWVCANAYTAGERFGREAGVLPWTILERNEQRIGIFALANPLTDSRSPGAQSLSFTDPIAAARNALDQLEEQGVDHTLCASHLGEEEGHGLGEVDDLAQAAEVDVICDGHTHGKPRIDHVAGTLLVRTSGNGIDVNELRFDGEWTATRHQAAEIAPDPAVEHRFDQLRAQYGLDDVVATVSNQINRSESARYHGEYRLGNFVTDAYRWAAQSDVGLQHSAGMREGPDLHGAVTVADLVSIVPFDMRVVRLQVTGDTLSEILASGGEVIIPSKPHSWHLHLSGGSLTFDYSDRELESAVIGDDPLDTNASYSVAAPENLFRSAGLTLSEDSQWFARQYEVLIEYAREEGIEPEIESRLTLHRTE